VRVSGNTVPRPSLAAALVPVAAPWPSFVREAPESGVCWETGCQLCCGVVKGVVKGHGAFWRWRCSKEQPTSPLLSPLSTSATRGKRPDRQDRMLNGRN
jgi:hypothetical protein